MPSLCANASVGPVDGHCTEWLTVQAGEDGEGPEEAMAAAKTSVFIDKVKGDCLQIP